MAGVILSKYIQLKIFVANFKLIFPTHSKLDIKFYTEYDLLTSNSPSPKKIKSIILFSI